MAVKTNAFVLQPLTIDNLGIAIVTWGGAASGAGSTPLANGDTGTPISLAQKADMAVQVTGTFGSGGSATLQGSLDGTNYYTLKDRLGNAVTLTAAGLIVLTGPVLWVRPNCTAGDGTTALVVTLCARTVKAG